MANIPGISQSTQASFANPFQIDPAKQVNSVPRTPVTPDQDTQPKTLSSETPRDQAGKTAGPAKRGQSLDINA